MIDDLIDMAMFSKGGVSSPDIWIVITILHVALISLVLNPLVFRHNINKKSSSIARHLYSTLSVTDWATCLVLPIYYSTGILPPQEKQCINDNNSTFCQTYYYKYSRAATVTEKAMGSVVWSLAFIPALITAALALSRWYQISFPLRVIQKKMVLFSLAGLCVFIVLVETWSLFKDDRSRFRINMQIASSATEGNIQGFLPLILFILIASISSTASMLTIRKILKSENVQRTPEIRFKRIKSAIKILLLNIGNVIAIAILFSRLLTNPQSVTNLVLQTATSFLPMLLSCFNPCVYILLTNNILQP